VKVEAGFLAIKMKRLLTGSVVLDRNFDARPLIVASDSRRAHQASPEKDGNGS
jgi:hypothetical protein